MFFKFPIFTLFLSVGAFLVFALPWTFLAWKDPAWARPYRIQNKPLDVRRWFWPSMRKIGVNSFITLLILIPTWPLIRLFGVHDGPLPPWYSIAAQLLFFILAEDFLYYWMHRAFHTKWLFKHIHSVHHHPVTPCAIAGNYFHPVEFIATTFLVILLPLLLGSHLVVLWIYVAFRQWVAADGHCGYDIPWSPTRFIPLYHGPAYHDFHHKRFYGNYAGFLSYLDRFFEGYAKGYSLYYNEHQKKTRKTGDGSSEGSSPLRERVIPQR